LLEPQERLYDLALPVLPVSQLLASLALPAVEIQKYLHLRNVCFYLS
jgi:hypothetical protein